MIPKPLIIESFARHFGNSGPAPEVFFCPGRVNLIGEHIDYNGGNVLPSTISQGIYAAVRFNTDSVNTGSVVRLRSDERDETIELGFAEIPPFQRRTGQTANSTKWDGDGWLKYPVGVLASLKQGGVPITGADIFFMSDLPIGAGVSSSAAIEVLTGYIFLSGPQRREVDRTALALRAQKVEREFVGVNCGIMDQFSVAQGKKGHAILLDCATLDFRYVPFELGKYRLMVMNTNKARELAASKYNERRAECETALAQINLGREKKSQASARDLCSVAEEDIQNYVSDPVVKRRAQHVLSEKKRVDLAVTALQGGLIREFGALMNDSHASLRTQYEVTGHELDSIVAAAQVHPGCIGARMTGAGFGGCAIALVLAEAVQEFSSNVGKRYLAETGLQADFFGGEPVGGVMRVE